MSWLLPLLKGTLAWNWVGNEAGKAQSDPNWDVGIRGSNLNCYATMSVPAHDFWVMFL